MAELLDRLRYRILPAKTGGDPNLLQPLNGAYRYWRDFWFKVYSDANSPESFVTDDFLRQDFITALFHEEAVVGLHLYSVFDLEQLACQEHRYFKFYPTSFFQFMRDSGSRMAMSMEFLTVDPEWRKSRIGVSLAPVLIGCGLKFFRHLPIHSVIGPARTDNKVNQTCFDFGFDCFQAGLVKRNFEVDLLVGFREKVHPYPDANVRSLTDRVWNEREDLTGITRTTMVHDTLLKKKAA